MLDRPKNPARSVKYKTLDAWSADNKPNLWGRVPEVAEMQSEGGATGAVHGALITGELTPFVLHALAMGTAPDAHVWERLNYIRLLDGWRTRPGAR